ncbi:glycosyltransferase family 4 protein [Angustibacter sp. McL0619]|uniref:glycosyltransferase family 4 protein n=1 Tax=Angustibacter sp. McL0619 TaxID=3415676 RepID=UPI003CE9957C
MRVLHVSDGYLPRLGGVERQVHDLAVQQRVRGDEVWVATRTQGPPEPGTRRLGADRLRPSALLRELSPDLVHCHSSVLSPLSWTFARAATRAGLPVVVTMHSMVPTVGPVAAGLRVVARSVGAGAVWTAVSGVCASALRLAADVPVHVLHNGVDPQAWGPAATGGAVTTVSSVMRLASRKRPLPYVEVLGQVERELGIGARWRAVIAGDGPQRDAVARSIRRHGLEHRVSLPGRLDRSEVEALMRQTGLYVAPAVLESFGIAALEARCAGVPVLAMRGAGVCEFVEHGMDGELVQDDHAMADRLVELLGEGSRLAGLARGARRPVVDQAWATVIRRCADVYELAGACEAGRRQPVAHVE